MKIPVKSRTTGGTGGTVGLKVTQNLPHVRKDAGKNESCYTILIVRIFQEDFLLAPFAVRKFTFYRINMISQQT